MNIHLMQALNDSTNTKTSYEYQNKNKEFNCCETTNT